VDSTARIDGVILVVSRQFFDRGYDRNARFGVFFFRFFKNNEMPDQVQQGMRVEHALDERFQLPDQGEASSLPSAVFQAMKRDNPADSEPALASKPSEITNKAL
jgi:hypothetical protein